MGKYHAYQVYEDTHNEFVSELPQGWVLSKFKYEVDYVEGPGILANDFHEAGVPLLRIQNVKDRFTSGDIKTYLDPQKVKDKWEHFKTKTGDLLISGSASTDLVTEVTEQYEGAVPYTGLIRLRAKQDRTDKNYVRYFVQSELFKKQIDNLKTGSTIQHFGPIHLQQIVYPSALVSEQTQIANFLDHETAKIDTLIEKQQQLIKLLKEKRQAVISHAVTKGLPSVNGEAQAPMKDSGVEWLGEVPEHWVVSPIKHLLRQKKGAVKAGPFGSHLKNSDMDGGDVKVITQKNVIKKNLSIGDSFISEQKYRELSGFTIEKEDVLITTRGTIGRTCVYSDEAVAILHPCLIRMQCDETKVIPELLALIIQDSGYAMEQILVKSNATTIEVIYSDNLVNTEICVPKTIDEQVRLLEFVELETDKFDSLVRKAESAISLMQERRTALISASVTGKIDVRNWQAPTSENQALEQTA
ncbi:restriction endonuclease subunit S [Vibrio vulnificus]|nr:restriction endonuclease subunit S [Vibrio vulnificus]ELV8608214.1 restriction endonuclease subunit S [Vibrio vulnificus]ELV8617132.1 restriction endonuclease subunit S [Vibrio vulnificus]